MGRADFKPKQHTVICSEHFRPECFSAFGNRKNLKHNAVPTVFAFQNPTQVGCWPEAQPVGLCVCWEGTLQRSHSCTEDLAQLVECWTSMQEAPGKQRWVGY